MITPDEVHIWLARIEQISELIQEFWELLIPSEHQRAQNFKFEKHRNAFITCRGYLRIILSKYLQIKPQEIEFNYTKKGKPYLKSYSPQNKLQFNLSHSQDLVIYAVTLDRRIGIDLEYLRPIPDVAKMAERFFSAREAQFINTCPEYLQSLAFFQAWTSKEAFLKATGEGIGGGLEKIEVETDPSKSAHLYSIDGDRDAAKNWYLTKISTPAEYLAVLATEGTIKSKIFDINDLGV